MCLEGSAQSSHSSHHPQEFLLAQFSLDVHESSIKPDAFHFVLPILTYVLKCIAVADSFIIAVWRQ